MASRATLRYSVASSPVAYEMNVSPPHLMASNNSGAVLRVPNVAALDAESTFITTRAFAAESSDARSPAIDALDNALSASIRASEHPVSRTRSNATPAVLDRVRPSNANGIVTIANTEAPVDIAVRSTDGNISNVAVPPRPAITNTIDALPISVFSLKRSFVSTRLSSSNPLVSRVNIG